MDAGCISNLSLPFPKTKNSITPKQLFHCLEAMALGERRTTFRLSARCRFGTFRHAMQILTRMLRGTSARLKQNAL